LKFKEIYILGAGYVGLANGLALASSSNVTFIDNDIKKIESLKNLSSPIKEDKLQDALAKNSKRVSVASTIQSVKNNSLVIISLPTNYDDKLDSFNTTIIEEVIEELAILKLDILVVIKSTVPIGFTNSIRKKYKNLKILFSPEFLREGKSFDDTLNPERIIVSPSIPEAKYVGELFASLAQNFDKKNLLIMGADEAEAVKLFSNTYLAMRVAFFNEIDTYCFDKNLETRDVILGMSKDSRIGESYNNPSFGYGGYCLPKDAKQAAALLGSQHNNLISSINISNQRRIESIANKIINLGYKRIGFYKINMKAGSDNFRESSSLKVIELVAKKGIHILIFEESEINLEINKKNISITDSFQDFISFSEIIVTNRIDSTIKKQQKEIFSRDIFHIN